MDRASSVITEATANDRRCASVPATVAERAFAHSAAALACTDARGCFTHVSPSFEAVMGLQADAAIGRRLDALAAADQQAELQALIDTLLAGTCQDARIELRREIDYGDTRWIDVDLRAVADGPGRSIQLMLTLVDVTARKQHEALQLQRQTLAMQNAGLGLWSWDLTNNSMSFDMLWAMSLGCAVSELAPVAATWRDRLHPDDWRTLEGSLLACLKGRTAEFGSEHRMRHQDGHWVWFFTTGMVTQRHTSGRALQVVGTSQDITLRKNAEVALQQSQLRQTMAIKSAGLGQWERHVPSGAASFDARFCEMLGYAPDELEPHVRTFLRIDFAEDREATDAWLALLIDGSVDHYRRVRRRRHKLGHTVWVLDNGRVLERDAQGRAVRMVGLYQDISDQHHLEATLRQAKEAADAASSAKSEFLANMSHEIRTPLNAIIGLTRIVLDADLGTRQRDYLTKVHSASKALLGILNDVLDYSKIEAGRMELELTPFSLEEPLNSVANLFGAQVEQKGLELYFEMAPGVPMEIVGDSLRLTQVLNNLVGNAIKFTERGEIRVKAELAARDESGCVIRVAVSDTGIGLTKEQAGRLFQAFTQADNSVTRKYGGTGLGLTISQKLVALMDGEITVSSIEGQGCTFSFTFRCSLPAAVAALPDLQRLRGLRALVVDDQETSRMILENMFVAWGMQVETTPSPLDALRRVHEREAAGTPYDVVLVDWRMPEMNGLDMARAMRQQSATGRCPPFAVMVTAFGREQLLTEASDLALDVVLTKPVVPSALFDILTRLHQPAGTLRAAPPIADTAAARFDGARILLAEDNALNQIVAREFLTSYGASVTVANDGAEALAIARTRTFDLVLMDLHMPVMDGIEAARSIRALPGWPGTPVVAMTAAVMSEDRGRCEAAGMVDFVAKPVDPDDLVRAMRRWLTASAATNPAAGTGSDTRVGSNVGDPASGSAPAATSALHALTLNGFDLAAALRRMRGNEERLTQLLRAFASQQRDAQGLLRAALDRGDQAAAMQQLHSIKGVAGTLGLMALADAACALETQVKDAATAPDDAAFAIELEQVLTGLGALAEPAAGAPMPAEVPAPLNALQRGALQSALGDLARYLRDQELVPDELLEDFKRAGAGALPAQPVAQLCRHIFDFDHEAALCDLKHMAASLDLPLPA